MRRINRSKERKAKRQKMAAENKFLREVRGDASQLDELDKRPGTSMRERRRLFKRLGWNLDEKQYASS